MADCGHGHLRHNTLRWAGFETGRFNVVLEHRAKVIYFMPGSRGSFEAQAVGIVPCDQNGQNGNPRAIRTKPAKFSQGGRLGDPALPRPDTAALIGGGSRSPCPCELDGRWFGS